MSVQSVERTWVRRVVLSIERSYEVARMPKDPKYNTRSYYLEVRYS